MSLRINDRFDMPAWLGVPLLALMLFLGGSLVARADDSKQDTCSNFGDVAFLARAMMMAGVTEEQAMTTFSLMYKANDEGQESIKRIVAEANAVTLLPMDYARAVYRNCLAAAIKTPSSHTRSM